MKPNCFVAGTLILAQGMLIHIENIQILEEVDSDSLVNLSESTLSDLQEITPQSHRVLELRLEKADGSLVQVLLVRALSWIETEKAELHRSLFLDLPEMGVRGNAKIVSISECSADSRLLSTGKRLVTGLFVHENAKVLDLYFEALEKPIGVTASHPFYSLSRKKWISAGHLYPSEVVKTKDGSATFLYKKARAGLHRVYNLEIHRDHNYYVSQRKLLVHNNSAEDDKAKIAEHMIKDHPERWGMNVEKIIKNIEDVMNDGKKYKAGNGNAIYVKKKSNSETWMVIHNLSDLKNKGTFIKRIKEEAHPSSIERYVKKFLKDNS